MANKVIIDFPGQRTRLHGSHWIPTHCLRKKKQLSLKKRAIYAAEATTVEPGCGVSLPVRFRQLDSDICHTTPVPQYNLEVDMFGSIPAALISPTTQFLPYANLGKIPIRVREGQLVGYVSHTEIIMPVKATINLVATKHSSEETDHFPEEAPVPVTLNPPSTESSIEEADVSHAFGDEYRLKIRQMLQKHEYLFRSELGLFNDGINMPIPFRDETDLKGLKQSPYRLTERDKRAMDSILDPLSKIGSSNYSQLQTNARKFKMDQKRMCYRLSNSMFMPSSYRT
jgi:hypothetical protein